MAISNVSKALQLINSTIEKNAVKITTPISRKTYKIMPIKGEDEFALKEIFNKNMNNDSFVIEKSYEILHKNLKLLDNESNYESFEEFLKNNSIFDIIAIIHGFNIATFKKINDFEDVCPHCNEKNKITNLTYDNFVNVSKEWDKSKRWNEYEVIYETDLSDELKLKTIMKIPSMYHNLQIEKRVLRENNFGANIFSTDTTKIGRGLKVIDKIILTLIKQSDEGEIKDETIIDNSFDIKIILEKMPENILEEILELYGKEIDEYIPSYMYKYECSNCKNVVEKVYDPVTEFLTRVILL